MMAGIAKRLLICDDEAAFARLVHAVGENMGYCVESTLDGEAFIDAYARFQPTTVVLDMIMPGMDGNELILWLAKQHCEARIVVITGYNPDYAAHAKILAEYKGLGPVTTLNKPVELSDLRAALA
jgi:CheY-like chemotaxis protein